MQSLVVRYARSSPWGCGRHTISSSISGFSCKKNIQLQTKQCQRGFAAAAAATAATGSTISPPEIDHQFMLKLITDDPAAEAEALQEGCTVVHLIRHAEALHNVVERQHPKEYFSEQWYLQDRFHDTRLTSTGQQQCESLRHHLSELKSGPLSPRSPQLIVASPLSRTLESALLVYAGLAPEHITPAPILASELCRERIADYLTDKRRTRKELQQEFGHAVDLSLILTDADEPWLAKETHPDEHASEACSKRAVALLEWLHAREETNMTVFSHWVFLKHLFAQFSKHDPAFDGVVLHNAQLLSVSLCKKSD